MSLQNLMVKLWTKDGICSWNLDHCLKRSTRNWRRKKTILLLRPPLYWQEHYRTIWKFPLAICLFLSIFVNFLQVSMYNFRHHLFLRPLDGKYRINSCWEYLHWTIYNIHSGYFRVNSTLPDCHFTTCF